jgi:hypothetical protein
MAITKRVSAVLATAAAAVAVIGLSATPAMASTTLTAKVSNGGSLTATAKLTTLKDGSAEVTCGSTKSTGSTSSGVVKTGTYKGASPLKVGTTSKLTFKGCTGPLGAVKTKVETVKNGYEISVDSTTSSKGITAGIIGPVKVAVSMLDCSFVVTGSAPGYFDNANHTLVVSPTLPKGVKALTKAQLTISGVPANECAGLVKNGQHPSYSAVYALSLKKISIKSTT